MVILGLILGVVFVISPGFLRVGGAGRLVVVRGRWWLPPLQADDTKQQLRHGPYDGLRDVGHGWQVGGPLFVRQGRGHEVAKVSDDLRAERLEVADHAFAALDRPVV